MVKYSIKCSRCGAPIQWNNASLNVSCAYCGQPVNQFKKEDNSYIIIDFNNQIREANEY